MSRLAEALTQRIATTKRRLLAGGVHPPVEWLDAFIEQRPALDHGTFATERADETVLTILDPLAISDSDFFRWGEPPHTYSVSKVDGIVKDEETGVRFFSEVFVIR